LPFDFFALGFIGYIKRSELTLMIMNKTKNPAEVDGNFQPIEPKPLKNPCSYHP
jgi:hypothetical protein